MSRALLSVYDKSGVVELAQGLADLGWELVSSRSTAAALTEGGLTVTDVAELTGYPPILGHRVVTLHPKVHGGLLADRSDPEHVAEMEQYEIQGIDLVVSNLYPFSTDPGIELIDIGGPAMVRAAAKNHEHVGVVVDPADYSRGARRAAGRRRPERRRPAAGWPARPSPPRRPTTRRSSPGSTKTATRTSPSRRRSRSAPSATRSRCGTARTPTSGRRSTAPTAPTRGGPT